MWSRARVVSCLILFGCGPKTQSDQPRDLATAEREPGRQRDQAVDPEPAGGCPREFAPSMQDAACEPSNTACSYPQAECRCIPRFPCTGVDRGPGAVLAHVWSCQVTDPTVLRDDGCPAAVPSAGSKCAAAGQICHYSPYCGGIQSTARCTDGGWQLEQRNINPPPSAE